MFAALCHHYAWTDARTFREIQCFHRDFLDILRAKSIDYASLRSSLTPQSKGMKRHFSSMSTVAATHSFQVSSPLMR